MVTVDYFMMKKRDFTESETEFSELGYSVNDSVIVENGDQTTDIKLSKDDKSFIIMDAYNGCNTEKIKRMLNLLKKGFKDAEEVYVVASMLSNLSQQRGMFELFKLGTNSAEAESIHEIEFGTISFNINKFSEFYRRELEIFAGEVYFWQLCEKNDTIIQNS